MMEKLEIAYLVQRDLDRSNREQKYHDAILAAGTSEDTEPEGLEVSFLNEPAKELYPPAWSNGKMRPECKKALKAHVLNAIELEFQNPDKFIYFTVYGSGASYNWAENGDFDVQMWVDIDKFNDLHENDANLSQDDLVAAIRRIVGPINFPTFADLGVTAPDAKEGGSGKMQVQFYPKPGTGSKSENLSSKPYACYDMETDEWLVRPKPIRPEFYGDYFLMIEPKAQDVAVQAEAALDELQRNITDWQFWYSMWKRYNNQKYKQRFEEARDQAEQFKDTVKTLFQGVFGGRAEAYSPEGKGIEDERDVLQKQLEVWGIFQRLKHWARQPLPWEETDMPSKEEAVKTCTFCHEKKTLGEFRARSDRPGQYTPRCKECLNKQSSQWRRENPDKVKSNWKGYQAENQDHLSAKNSKWRSENKDAITEYQRKYRQEHPEKKRESEQRRRATLAGVPTDNVKLEKVLARDGNICYLCGGETAKPTLDHVIPLSRGGSHTYDNIRIACGSCNSRKKDRLVAEGAFKTADWNEIMQNAQWLRDNNHVQVQNRMQDPDSGQVHTIGQVESQENPGEYYETEIWQDDPNSQAITLWSCDCPWGQKSWGRTRQWKKYEGRPCKHTLALYWQSLGTPVENAQVQTPQQPAQPQMGETPQDWVQAPSTPGGANFPVQPINQEQEISGSEEDEANQPAAVEKQQPPTMPFSQPSKPNEEATIQFPGALSSWRVQGSFRNGDIVRNSIPMEGIDRDNVTYKIPRNSSGEVIWSDDNETIVIFPLKTNGKLESHLVRVTDATDNFYLSPSFKPF